MLPLHCIVDRPIHASNGRCHGRLVALAHDAVGQVEVGEMAEDRDEKKFTMAWKVIDHCIAESITEKKKLRSLKNHKDGGGKEKANLLSSYINDDDDEEQQDSHRQGSTEFDKFLRDTAINFIFAGRDTTGAALIWFFWLICNNPVVESNILEELRSTPLGKQRSSSNDLTIFDPEELSKLVYLHAALCESLRLFPPLPFHHQAALRHEVLPSGHRVEAGTKILSSLYSRGRMERIWGMDCLEFRPERWISEEGRVRHEPSCKFMSFGSGRRTCLGKEVAFTKMKAVVAAMVYNFQVQVLQGHVVEPKLSVILHMKNGLRVRIKRRAESW